MYNIQVSENKIKTLLNSREFRAVIACEERVDKKGKYLLLNIYHCGSSYYLSNANAYRTYDKELGMFRKGDATILYKKMNGKHFRASEFLSNISNNRVNSVCYINKKHEKLAIEYFGSDPVNAIFQLEMKHRMNRLERESKRSDEKLSLFSSPAKPSVSLETILMEGKKHLPNHIIYDNGHGTCSACNTVFSIKRTTKTVTCPHCGKEAKLTTRRPNDSVWLYVPRVSRNGTIIESYYYIYQTFNDNDRKFVLHVTEAARRIGNDEWCYDSYSGQWKKGANPHFIRSWMGRTRDEWCDWNYIIPRQFSRFIKMTVPESKDLPLTDFFATADRSIWRREYDDFKSRLQNPSLKVKHGINLLLSEKLNLLAYVISVSKYKQDEFNWDADNASDFFNGCINSVAMKDLKKSDKAADTLNLLWNKSPAAIPNVKINGCHVPLNTCVITPLKLNDTFYLLKTYGTCFGNDYYLQSNSCTYRKVGDHWYYTKNISLYGFKNLVDKEVFVDFIGKEHCAYVPELINSANSRINILELAVRKSMNPVMIISLVEKLRNAGFERAYSELLSYFTKNSDIYFHNHSINVSSLFSMIDSSKTSLSGMLNIPKHVFPTINRNTTLDELVNVITCCKKNPGLSADDFKRCMAFFLGQGKYSFHPICLMENGKSIKKTISYLEASQISTSEYESYICNLKKLHVSLDSKHVFPFDFEKVQEKASKEIKGIESVQMNENMRILKEVILTDPSMKNFLESNTQYKVLVPENARELVEEGISLHNCLGTYVKRVSSGDTTVFFIRKADEPDTSYVAMEYKDGRIVQIREACNVVPVDANLCRFVDGLSNVLRMIDYVPSRYLARTT